MVVGGKVGEKRFGNSLSSYGRKEGPEGVMWKGVKKDWVREG